MREKILRVFKKGGPYYLFYWLMRRSGLLYKLSDKSAISIEYQANMGGGINWKSPKTYNEKLQWLKLYDRNPLYTILVDKYLVKDWVANHCTQGTEILIKTLGRWNSFDEIDFTSLPDRFVLKTNHGSGNTAVVICRDKSIFNKDDAKQKLESSLMQDVYKVSREWPYKNVKRCIIAEEYMEDKKTGELRDYKFFCFDGEPKALFVASGRQNHEEPFFDFYDIDFNHLDLRCPHPQSDTPIEKPETFEVMKDIARQLSKGFPHVRVDLYEINGKPYFGEMTFYHWEGLMPFYPEEWNYRFGEWLILPESNIKNERH